MKRIALMLLVCMFVAAPASADLWVDVPVVNADFETFTGTAPAVNFTGWLQEDMELGTNLGNSTNWAKFDNPGGSNASGNIRQLITCPVYTDTLSIGFKFRGTFGVGAAAPMDALFRAMVHADEDGTGNLYDMYKVVYSANQTTGWMDVVTYWNLPKPIGSLSPNTRIKFQWDRADDRLYSSGIDDVVVRAVPVPGAALLAILGLSAAGVKLRRRRA